MVVTKGFLETKDIRTTIIFDITVLTQNTGNSPKNRSAQAMEMTIIAEVHGIIGHGTV